MPARVGPFEREPELDDASPDDSRTRSSAPISVTRPCRVCDGCQPEGLGAGADLPGGGRYLVRRRLRAAASRRAASGQRPARGQEDAGGGRRAGKGQILDDLREAGCMLYLYGDTGTTYLYIHLNNDLTMKNDNL